MSEINPMNNKKYIEAVSFRDWQTCDLICDEHSVLVDRIKNLEQELQKTREQLEKAEKVIEFYGNPETYISRNISAGLISYVNLLEDREQIREYKHPDTDWLGTVNVGGKRAREALAKVEK